MLFVGIGIGILWVVSIIVAFMVGYGLCDQKNSNTEEEQVV